MKKKTLPRVTTSNPWLFFIVTFSLTWAFWIPAAFSAPDWKSALPFVILGGALGKLGPAIALAYLTYSPQEWRDYWKRAFDYKRIGLKWWVPAILLMPLFAGLGILTDVLMGGSLPTFEKLTGLLANPLMIVPYLLWILLYGPLPEELGWCGYELDRLQAKYSALKSSIILGVFWALWHLPLFFIPGTWMFEEIGLGSTRFWLDFIPGIISLQILQTWLYNNNRRSTLTAILIHFMLNLTGELLDLPVMQEFYRTMWTVVFTIGVVFMWGPKTLRRQSKPETTQGLATN